MDDGKANAFGHVMMQALSAALDRAAGEADITVIRGREGVLCGGFDLKVIRGDPSGVPALVNAGQDLLMKAWLHPQPLLIGVTGHAVAAGALLVLTADYRIGMDGDFRIGLNETAIGLTLPAFAIELAAARLASLRPHRCAGRRLSGSGRRARQLRRGTGRGSRADEAARQGRRGRREAAPARCRRRPRRSGQQRVGDIPLALLPPRRGKDGMGMNRHSRTAIDPQHNSLRLHPPSTAAQPAEFTPAGPSDRRRVRPDPACPRCGATGCTWLCGRSGPANRS